KDAAAFSVEPIQGEGGIIVPPEDYLKGAETLCKIYDTHLILDEIQTGLGRTGKMFAAEHYGVKPDIMTLAKSLGGGVMPIGAFITTPEVWEKAYGGINKCLHHTSTFGGNTRACVAALATLEVIYEENLIEQAQEKGNYLLSKLNELKTKHNMIKEVRGKGLMAGIEFYEPTRGQLDKIGGSLVRKLSHEYLASMMAFQLLDEYKVITAYTLNNPNVIRLEPPLSVTFEQIDLLIKAFDEICSRYKGFLGLTLQTGKFIASKIFKKIR
ncbi:MAG: aminotransferase class III-fold pyridoxal phosphate-dependent enzyme, partial [Candidatus Subteraquimicrobiales bacterium]|nr:aminotransferase class III-fold pyridoxal phosphate-dependent enzyme [Candidatus Subteraquimicrobiales bacterium]